MREREMTGFQGIFLDETSKKRLIALQEKKLKYIVRDMHITFKFGKTEKYPEEVLNKDYEVKIVGLGKACEIARINLSSHITYLSRLRNYYFNLLNRYFKDRFRINGSVQNRLPRKC